MVGIALLTLVPGELGGSETYVRELLRALGRGGELDYRVLLPPVAAERRAGCRPRSRPSTAAARTTPERLAAMTLAAARPGPLRARLARRRRRPLPADDADPAGRAADASSRCTTCSTSTCRSSSRGASARSGASPGTARSRGADRVIVISGFVRDRAVELLGSTPARVGVDPLGHRP